MLAALAAACSSGAKDTPTGEGQDRADAAAPSDAPKSPSDGGQAALPKPSSFDLVPCPQIPPSTDPKCQRNGAAGSVGTGATFPDSATDGVGAGIQSAFVEAAKSRIVLVVGGVLTGGVKHGAVFAVDLATGNRRFVSGTILDPATGPKTAGKGPDLLAQTIAIAPGPDGAWYTLADTNTNPPGILRIDPETGDRTLAVDFKADAIAKSLPCSSLIGGPAIAPDGKIYSAFQNIDFGRGVVEIVPGATPQCRAIVNNKDGATGSGAKPDDPWHAVYARGKVWVFDKGGLYVVSIDPATGASVKVSAKGGVPGSGDKCFGNSGFAMNDDILWTYSTNSSTGCTGTPPVISVDPTNGARGSAAKVADGLGSGSVETVIPLPGQKRKLIYADKNRFYLYDLDANLVNVFSH